MALSTYTLRTLSAGFTQQQLYDEIKAAMLVAGFSAPFDEVGASGSTMELIFAYTFNASTYGTAYLRITVSTGFVVGTSVLAGWNATTNTATGAGQVINYSPANTNQLNIITINNIEARGICMSTSAVSGSILLVRPQTKPIWWNENTWPYYFHFPSPVPSASQASMYSVASAFQPATNSSVSTGFGANIGSNGGIFNTINPVTGQSDLFSWGLVTTRGLSNSAHYGGEFSSDLGFVQGAGRTLGDTFNSQWIYTGNGVCFKYA